MIQAKSPLGHHLFQVPVAERIAQIPTKAQDDDLVLKVSPAKQCQPLVLHSFTIPDRTQSVCDRSPRSIIYSPEPELGTFFGTHLGGTGIYPAFKCGQLTAALKEGGRARRKPKFTAGNDQGD
jgi:hypothetical protein